MTELSIVTLGPLRMTLHGEPLRGFRTDKERALLVYLAIEAGRSHRREALVGLLWPHSPEEKARHALSQALTDLRRLLGDRDRTASPTLTFLETTRHTVELGAAREVWVDVHAFDALTLPKILSPGGNGARERLQQAVTLYQGSFLEGFSLPDAPAFEEWQLLRRERLRRQVLEALALLVERYTREGAYEDALRYAWRRIELEPWSEDAHCDVIRLLALVGQQGAALRQGEICSRILREELGVEPGASTRALVRAVRAGTLSGAALDASKVPQAPVYQAEQEMPNVPSPLMPLIGRDVELQELDACLCDPTVRLLTLVGPGGIGKTRLALEFTAIEAPRFPDGAYVVPLVAATSWEACVAEIARAVGVVPSTQFATVEQQLLGYLRDKAMLLMLDNLEHLVAHVPRLVDLMESAGALRIIATSRVRLGALGERIYPVGPLAVPEEAAQTPASRMPAALVEVASVKLFTQSAQRVTHDFRLSEAYAPAVAAICRLVEGVPLALLLAAAWTDVLKPDEILERLVGDTDAATDRPIDFLHASWPEMPARHRSVRAVFDHTWRLMGAREQALVQALSVFRGGFGSEAAFFVVGATLSEIRRLVDQSLLARAFGNRYEMQELLRQYAAERFAQAPTTEREMRDRHAAYYVGVLRRWFETAKGPLQVAALAEMDGEIDNARAAWDWILEQEDIGQLVQAVDGLMLYYARRVRRDEAKGACLVALERLEGHRMPVRAEQVERQTLVAKLLVWYGELESGTTAEALVDRALALLSSPDRSVVEARVELGRALRCKASLLENTDRARATALYEESLSCLRAAGDRWEEADTLNRLAYLCSVLGDLDATRGYSENLLSIARSIGDLRASAWALLLLGADAMYRGQMDESIRLAGESLAVRRELDDPLEVAAGLQSLATRYVVAGRPDRALPLYDECIEIMDRLGLPAPYGRGVKAWSQMLAGDYDQAQRLVHRALEEARASGDRRLTAWNEQVVGSLALVNGDVEGAVARLAHAAEEFRALGEPNYLGMALSFLGYAYRASGDRDRACACLHEVLQTGEHIGGRQGLAWALPGIALLYADAGHAARAHALVTVVKRSWPMVPASRWLADVAGPAYHAALAALSPQQVEEAERSVALSDMQTEARAILANPAIPPGL
jgi:DNA-binding SARP family transcriptional activator/predicted ATPase